MIARRFRPGRAVEVAAHPASGAPLAVRWRGRRRRVARVEESWEVATGWWRDDSGDTAAPPGAALGMPPCRRYYRLATREGLRCVVYRDLPAGRWYLVEVLD